MLRTKQVIIEKVEYIEGRDGMDIVEYLTFHLKTKDGLRFQVRFDVDEIRE